jgi:hypothetical protein
MNIVQHFAGMPIIIDKFAYSEKVTYRAVAVVVDVNRPNRVKPIYKRVRFVKRTPRAYLVKGMGYVMHPDIYRALQKRIGESMRKSVDGMTRSMFGLSAAMEQTTLTMDSFIEAWKKLP